MNPWPSVWRREAHLLKLPPLRKLAATPPPFCMAGSGVLADRAAAFSEAEAAETGLNIDPGYELMEYFLKSGGQ